MMEEEEEGGVRMAAAIYVIQSCSLWKTPVVLQFAKSYKLIFKKLKIVEKNEKQEKKSFSNNTRNFKLKKKKTSY
jgi:hypothetical protein